MLELYAKGGEWEANRVPDHPQYTSVYFVFLCHCMFELSVIWSQIHDDTVAMSLNLPLTMELVLFHMVKFSFSLPCDQVL